MKLEEDEMMSRGLGGIAPVAKGPEQIAIGPQVRGGSMPLTDGSIDAKLLITGQSIQSLNTAISLLTQQNIALDNRLQRLEAAQMAQPGVNRVIQTHHPDKNEAALEVGTEDEDESPGPYGGVEMVRTHHNPAFDPPPLDGGEEDAGTE